MTPRDDRATLYGFRRNLVVAASAGTGKTHALVGVLVHLALGATDGDAGGLATPLPLTRVVATTFSRKAAAEIRARFVEALTRLASADPIAAYRGDLLLACERARVPPFGADELATRAARALDGVGQARIGTLHGFAAAIVRAYGLSAGWAPGFAIESEEDTEARAREAASNALEQLLSENEAGARDLIRLGGGVEPLVGRAADLLEQLAEDGRGAASLRLPTDDARAIEEKIQALISHARGLGADESLGPPATALCDAWASADLEGIERSATDLCAVAARGRAGDRAQRFFEFRNGLPGASHAERGRALVKAWSARRRILPQSTLFKTWLERAETGLRASMLRDSVLGFGDVLRAARDTMALDEDAARDIGLGLDALLIDEFQDTSRLQREIVELAWQEPGECQGVPGLPRIARVRRRGLLVVGDRKQSIYAFRGADVGSFAELCVGLAGRPAREALRVPPGRVWEPEVPSADFVALRENRRSAPEILSFVNAYSKLRLVASSEPPQLYEVQYAPAIEDLAFAGESTPRADHVRAEPRVTWTVVPPARGAASSSRMTEAEVIVRQIELMLERGTPRVRGSAPCPKDIAVLAIRNAMLDATAYALARAGIPYVVAGNGFFAAREVLDMLAMLAFIVDPDDVLARVAVLRGVWCGASDETLVALTDAHAGVADAGRWDDGARRASIRPEDRPRLQALRDVVLGLRSACASIGPAETLRQAARALDLEETLALLPRGQQRIANVRKLITLAERESDARAFLTRIQRLCDEERPEPEAATFSEEDDAVRLLTVHASKGLDFPIVFLPEAGAIPRGAERSPIVLHLGPDAPRIAMRVLGDDGLTYETPSYAAAQADAAHRELAEWARLSYVASTRAREAMFFVGDRRVPRGEKTSAYRATTAATLVSLAEASEGPPLLAVQTGPLPEVDRNTAAPPPARVEGPAAVALPSTRSVALTASEMADFAVCARRFQLAHLLRVPEPGMNEHGAPLAAHGDEFAARAIEGGARVERDKVYLCRAASTDRTMTVCGTVDLWIEHPDGHSEGVLVDAKRGSPRTRVLAALAGFAAADRSDHRTGILSPLTGLSPEWQPQDGAASVEQTRQNSLAWGRACVEARWTGRFPRAPIATCQAVACGFVSLCHEHRRA